MGVGNSFFRGTFSMKIWIEVNTAIPVIVIDEPKSETATEIVVTPVVIV